MTVAASADRPPTGRAVGAVMRRIGAAIERLDNPAVEKIADEQQGDPFQVLVATMLSAQTQDPVTLAASTRLFAHAATPSAMLRLEASEIEKLIFPVSFYRNKARHVLATCRQLLDRYGGRVPATMDELLELPGVGRKTANLVLIVAHGSGANICVDTHVHRIANRLGWVRTRTPEQTEQVLYGVVPRRWWASVNLYLVTWGQNVCRPIRPRCRECAAERQCARVGVTNPAPLSRRPAR